jgi:hypothetical protein
MKVARKRLNSYYDVVIRFPQRDLDDAPYKLTVNKQGVVARHQRLGFSVSATWEQILGGIMLAKGVRNETKSQGD